MTKRPHGVVVRARLSKAGINLTALNAVAVTPVVQHHKPIKNTQRSPSQTRWRGLFILYYGAPFMGVQNHSLLLSIGDTSPSPPVPAAREDHYVGWLNCTRDTTRASSRARQAHLYCVRKRIGRDKIVRVDQTPLAERDEYFRILHNPGKALEASSDGGNSLERTDYLTCWPSGQPYFIQPLACLAPLLVPSVGETSAGGRRSRSDRSAGLSLLACWRVSKVRDTSLRRFFVLAAALLLLLYYSAIARRLSQRSTAPGPQPIL